MKVKYLTAVSSNDVEMMYPIYMDDTIEVIKQKICVSMENMLSKKISIEEVYIYSKTRSKLNSFSIVERLTSEQPLISFKLVKTFLMNYPDINKEKIPEKDGYDYFDFYKLGFLMDNSLSTLNPISLNSFNNKFVTNPFLLTETELGFSESIDVNTQYNKILLDFPKIENEELFCVLAEDVFKFYSKNSRHGKFVSKTYFPFLYQKEIYSLEELDKETKPSYLTSKYKAVNELYGTFRKFSDVPLKRQGITYMQLKISPFYTNALPLGTVFNFLHASETYPFIKFNPGYKIENLVKMFAPGISENDAKIPLLSQKVVLELNTISAKDDKLSVYIHNPEHSEIRYMLCEFDSDSNIYVSVKLNKFVSLDELSVIFLNKLNPLLLHVNNHIEPYGISLRKFIQFNDNSVEIVNITYNFENVVEESKSIDSIFPCLSHIFNILEPTDDNIMELTFKKISNFAAMNPYELFIADMLNSSSYSKEDIMDSFVKSFINDFDDVDAVTDKAIELLNELSLRGEQNPNAKIKAVKHPGFPLVAKYNKKSRQLHIEISKINNINYLEVLSDYVKFMYSYFNKNTRLFSVCKLYITTI